VATTNDDNPTFSISPTVDASPISNSRSRTPKRASRSIAPSLLIRFETVETQERHIAEQDAEDQLAEHGRLPEPRRQVATQLGRDENQRQREDDGRHRIAVHACRTGHAVPRILDISPRTKPAHDRTPSSLFDPRRMTMNRVTTCFLASLALSAVPAAAQGNDLSKVEIKPTKMAGSVWMLEGAGGNIGVSSGSDGLLIVDDQFLPLADKIKAALKGISPSGKLAFVVNTHWHGDHTGGNRAFGKDATIIAQSNVRKRLATKQEQPGHTVEASPPEALPVVTFEDGVTIWFNGEEIQAIHLPHGHTDGDAVIFFKTAKVVHMGDLFFNGRFPFIDVASGGDLAGYVKNVGDLIAKIPADAKIIPGHGAPATLADLKAFHAMLTKTADHVRGEIAKGMTLQDAKKAGLPEEWKSWSWDFISTDTWVETLYSSLKK
jgi:glyoxylase-like metal-dependent hydrolase (beta-lactamase superfamily II)